ncbi:hypothetical protein SPAN111604_14815 [Sphingomonas antarctica]|uniref:hypothetical protein n=1 Tax=Sphingomonas antarctica TaxID=2040274 RepID=UPI0039ECBC42
MPMPQDDASDGEFMSARALLERLYYGHSAEVEAILRFAHTNKLQDDDLVFLLVSVLKGNEELVRLILQAIAATDRVIDNARESGVELNGMAQQLVAQIQAAANRSTGKLNLAADRLANTVRQVEDLCAGIIVAGQDLRRVEGVIERAVELHEGKNALDRLIDQIRRQARADLTSYHSEIMEELSRQVRREAWAIHAYGMTGMFALACAVLGWAIAH